jgi:hypothetical protein
MAGPINGEKAIEGIKEVFEVIAKRDLPALVNASVAKQCAEMEARLTDRLDDRLAEMIAVRAAKA